MIGKVIVTNELSSRMSRRAVGPKRTRIFYYAAPTWPRVRLSVKSPIGVADPQGYETGHFLSSAKNPRVPHPSRFLRRVGFHESRYRPSRIPPFAKKERKGWAPAFSWCFLPCQTPTRGLIENLFPFRKPHEVRQCHQTLQKIRGSAGEGPAVLPISPQSVER
jgi:hypothetical protein